MSLIKSVSAREILDSRGNPTIETLVTLDNGIIASASVPSGTSVGKYEAFELRDRDPKRYEGMGVLKAINNVNNIIAPKIIGTDIMKQGQIDTTMIQLDGTVNKSNLGANSILSVSLAACRAAAITLKIPLFKYISMLITRSVTPAIAKIPAPTFNLINGGKHGAGNLDIQEFHVVTATNKTYHEAIEIGEEIYQQLKNVLITRNAVHSVGDEGGFAPNLYTNMDAMEILKEAITNTPYKFGFEIFFGIDVAASNLYKENSYFVKDSPTPLSTDDFIDYLKELHRNYNLLLLEDPLAEDDWYGWKKINQELGRDVLIVGDDLLVTNPSRLKKAIDENACSGILIKPNQIGTLSETLQVIIQAKKANFKIIVSHRSGETNDTFIADLAVGVAADYVKFGAPARGERVAKYNRLLEIEQELKK